MPNYEFKSHVMGLGLHQLFKDISKSKYKSIIEEINQDKISKGIELDYIPKFKTKYDYETAMQIESEMQEKFPDEWKEASRINHASIVRVLRLKKRIARMLLSGTCLFLTLTFTDDVLSRTSKATRRQYVRRFLSSYNCHYVANIDYGAKKGREHYHAVIETDHVDPKMYPYGAINFKKIHPTPDDNARVAKYIAKLTNHAIKDTAKQNYMIYSR